MSTRVEAKATFERLIRDASQQDVVDNFSQTFDFTTVFYISPYSYRCCTCAYEHEFFDYLTENGINEDIFKRILENIERGSCPHMDDKISWRCTKHSSVGTAHIASAVGLAPPRFSTTETAIFQLEPHMIALLKKRLNVVDQYNRHYRKLARLAARGKLAPGGEQKLQGELINAFRSTRNANEVILKPMAAPEACVRLNEPFLLRSLKEECFLELDLSSAFKTALQENMADFLFHIIALIIDPEYEGIFSCIMASFVYNEPDILMDLLKLLQSFYENCDLTAFKTEITVACHFLRHEKCADILQNFGMLVNDDRLSISDGAKIEKLLSVFSMFPERMSEEIGSVLRKNPRYLRYINDQVASGQVSDTIVLKEIANVGGNLNYISKNGNTFILDVLYFVQHNECYHRFRGVLELLMYENLDVEQNRNVVKRAILVDAAHLNSDLSLSLTDLETSQTFLMDGKEHSLYGQDEQSYALNFAAPLLLECGYPAKSSVLTDALNEKLHKKECDYFRQWLDQPRTLRWMCCIALRKHFKGRAIHRFVEAAGPPEIISDFILFKNVLKTL